MNWDENSVDIQPPPLKRECANCGIAASHLNRMDFCQGCEEEHDADMREVEAREKEDHDRYMREMYYSGR